MRLQLFAAAAAILCAGGEPPVPLPNDYTNSIKTRWLNKPVRESRLLDGAEDLSAWKLVNTGQARGALNVTEERSTGGRRSVRLTSPTTGDKPIPTSRYYGGAGALRVVAGEDWSAWNRLSVWIYPDLPGFRVVSLVLVFHNDGAEKVPDVYGKMGLNYVILQNQQWNRVVWEIANLPRDKVTGVEFSYRLQGNEPGAADQVSFDIDQLELEKVEADHYLGWKTAPGEFAFSHSGYQTGAPKSAIAGGFAGGRFELINVESGLPVLSKEVKQQESRIGRFQVLDFSEVQAPGSYVLRTGGRASRPFRIGGDVWKPSIEKAINFFYAQRCGYAIPGVHDICHRDWTLVRGDRKMIANGGWHDAGDLSQSFVNTAEAAYAMYSLAERMQTRNEDPRLLASLLAEAQWGLDWILKTTFHDGFRPGFCTMDRWTNGILGDVDDMVCNAVNSTGGNFAAAAAEALAARVLRRADPLLASYSLKQAVEDWGFAVKGLEGPQRGARTELAGHAILAGLELWQTTGDRQYADRSIGLAALILDSQQRAFLPDLTYPLTGFFYTGPDRARILRYSHVSHEGAPVAALARLCELFPQHPDWMKWYSAVALYADYFMKTMAQFTQPYGMLASSVHHDEEYKQAGGGRGVTPEAYREQVLNGVPVGPHHYARLFPVWFEFRGNHGTVLTQTKGVSAAAHLRGNFELASLAQLQLQWVAGRNPFAQSTMWGEGYDYAPQYSAMSGDLVGSLPVGIQTRGNGDEPYWPTENCHNWKEVWVLPVTRWLWLMRDLAGPAAVTGVAEAGDGRVELRDLRSGFRRTLQADSASGRFAGSVPEGEYEVTAGEAVRRITLLPGGTYYLDLQPGRNLDLRVTAETRAGGAVVIKAALRGSGVHTVSVRADNLTVTQPGQRLDLKPGAARTVGWEGKMKDPGAPWFAVVIPDNDLTQRQEVSGDLHRPAAGK
jgi:hypothetical protein